MSSSPRRARKARSAPAAVGTSQAQIARIEKGDADCRISSVERYAAALGFEVRYQLVPANGARKTAKRAATQKRL